MSYQKHNFESGNELYASQLNEMDDQIAANEGNISNSVSYVAQSMGTEYKATARNNIGAVGMRVEGNTLIFE